jgi:DNA (cytosine-5)-methyltransferase 1
MVMLERMRALSLFSGIGGFDLAATWAGIEIAGMVEWDPFCQKVLKKHWPAVKLMGDIHNVRGDEFGPIDIIYGGPPCQPASCAGKRGGKEDPRWLWGETYRIIRSSAPTWIILENVRGILSLEGGMVFENLLFEMESYGYETRAFCLPACAVGAPHRRDRVWIVANAGCGEQRQRSESNKMSPERDGKKGSTNQACGSDRHAPDTEHTTPSRHGQDGGGILPVAESIRPDNGNQWAEDWYTVALRTCVRGIHDGLPRVVDRVNRLKALGNSIVPQVAYQIFRAIVEVEHGR